MSRNVHFFEWHKAVSGVLLLLNDLFIDGGSGCKSENKLLEFCLIMPALALAAIYFSKQGDDNILMRALSVTLLYNILMAGIFFTDFDKWR